MLKRLDHLSFRARSIAMRICVGALLGIAPPSLHAQEADRVSLWLTLFERPATPSDDASAQKPVPVPYGRIGFITLDGFFFQTWNGQVLFRGHKPPWLDRQSAGANRKARFSTTILYGPARQEGVRNQTDWVHPLYRVMREGDVIYVEKAYFEERAERIRQLNLKKKKDRKELATFENNPLFVLEREGDRVEVWQITSMPNGFRLTESIVIADAGNTLKFYNGRPPLVGEEDDWTIKVTHSGFMSDRLGYIEANDAETGWQLRQSNEAPVVGVSKGMVSTRARVGAGQLYTAYMTDDSFIVNALVLFGQRMPLKSEYQSGLSELSSTEDLLDQPIQFELGNFILKMTRRAKK
jgi:hypothetical protein